MESQMAAAPVEHRGWRVAILLALVLTLCILWWAVTTRLKLDFAEADRDVYDYAALSLAHALNIEHWVEEGGPREVSYGQVTHPGIPFQLVSWLALRGAWLFYPADAGDHVRYTIENPELFWRANQLLALFLAIAGLAGLWWLARRSSLGYTCAALLALFTLSQSARFGFLALGNEIFALPLALAIFGLAHRAFTSEQEGWWRWAGLGALGGLALLVKLNYAVWPLAVGLGMLAQLGLRTVGVRQLAARAGIFLFSLGATFLAVGALVLGPGGLEEMMAFQYSVIFHAGLYGEGQPGLVDWAAALRTLRAITYTPSIWVMSGLVLVLTAAALFRHRADRPWLNKNLPYAVCLTAAVVLGYGVAIKHFNEHYLIPPMAVLPLIILWLGESMGRWVGYALAVVALGFVCLAGKEYYGQRSAAFHDAEAARRDWLLIHQLPLEEGRIRLWALRTYLPPASLGFARGYNGDPDADFRGFDTIFPEDLAYNHWSQMVRYNGKMCPSKEVPWQFAVFDRATFPTFESLPGYFKEDGKQLGDYEAVIVMARVRDK
jgi:hypothetical protein